MNRKVLILAHDYWHSADSIEPLCGLLFGEGWDAVFTKDPAELYSGGCDLMLSFKDPIENDQIPTPIWCDEKWTAELLGRIENGMGFIGLHAALTDLPAEHDIPAKITRCLFISHPEQCPVSFLPTKLHPVTEGVEEFTFPTNDEHYIMKLLDGERAEVLAATRSEHGEQPAVWTNQYGKGRIVCVTPAHTTENLTCGGFVKLLSNAVRWVTG